MHFTTRFLSFVCQTVACLVCRCYTLQAVYPIFIVCIHSYVDHNRRVSRIFVFTYYYAPRDLILSSACFPFAYVDHNFVCRISGCTHCALHDSILSSVCIRLHPLTKLSCVSRMSIVITRLVRSSTYVWLRHYAFHNSIIILIRRLHSVFMC